MINIEHLKRWAKLMSIDYIIFIKILIIMILVDHPVGWAVYYNHLELFIMSTKKDDLFWQSKK